MARACFLLLVARRGAMTGPREQLLESVASRIVDYRARQIAEPTAEHVDRWISQFDERCQVALLRELDHVLGWTYFSRDNVSEFLDGLLGNAKLATSDPVTFWGSVNFLDIQAHGSSQSELLELFGERLRAIGIEPGAVGSADGPLVYIDDVLFTGNRVGEDLSRWIADAAPTEACVHVIVIATHALGAWQMQERVKKAASDTGKTLTLHVWRAVEFENRKAYRNAAEVLWPTELPDDPLVHSYASRETKFPFEPRTVGSKLANPIFSGEEGRALLERELLLAGVNILEACKSPKAVMRPLGFSNFGLGFGSTIVTFRNCPNNAPLALWWGDPDAAEGSALGWYPLFPRLTHAQQQEVAWTRPHLS